MPYFVHESFFKTQLNVIFSKVYPDSHSKLAIFSPELQMHLICNTSVIRNVWGRPVLVGMSGVFENDA